MPKLSILNDVLGPIMVGPSSSHTAGTTRLALMARQLLGEEPASAVVSFDPGGSLALTYRGQGSDRGYTGGLLGLEPSNPDLGKAPELAKARGVAVRFVVSPLAGAEHPNTTRLELTGVSGRQVDVQGASTGGGMMQVDRVGHYPVLLAGDDFELLAAGEAGLWATVAPLLERVGVGVWSHTVVAAGAGTLVNAKLHGPLPDGLQALVALLPGVRWAGTAAPVVPVAANPAASPLFPGATEMVAWAEANGKTFGEAALAYELNRSGWSVERADAHMARIWNVMKAAVQRGLTDELTMTASLFAPSAPKIRKAFAAGRLLGGPVSLAVAYSTAVMEVSNAMGVVVAAPTAGSCGVVPGVLAAAAEQLGSTDEQMRKALWAAGGAGLIVARKATFAAEVAGCQAEVGVASAMAAAALVELAGGTARQAEEAASVAMQNSLGMICDPVAGLVQVPCFGKNAMGCGNAYTSADMILGGYRGLIPFDEVATAMLAVGKAMPRELRCTALGGCATTPTGERLMGQFQNWVQVQFPEDGV
ncbi:MAG TPA: L-serine ammonia-lyase, iron-sulfur-dependent, subunit alpha [Symbiobacteriaceae bacterium]